MREVSDEVAKIYSKILTDIEHHAPLNFTYKIPGCNLTSKLSDVNHYYKSSIIDLL